MPIRLFLLTLVMFAINTQIAADDDKKTSGTKTKGSGIEITDYGFGVSMPVTSSSRVNNGKGNASSAQMRKRIGGSSGKH